MGASLLLVIILIICYIIVLSIKKPKPKYDYKEIYRKYQEKDSEYFEEALETYPSKHLLDNKEKWEEMIEKQWQYKDNKINL